MIRSKTHFRTGRAATIGALGLVMALGACTQTVTRTVYVSDPAAAQAVANGAAPPAGTTVVETTSTAPLIPVPTGSSTASTSTGTSTTRTQAGTGEGADPSRGGGFGGGGGGFGGGPGGGGGWGGG